MLLLITPFIKPLLFITITCQSTFVPLICFASSATVEPPLRFVSGFSLSDLQHHVSQIQAFALLDATRRNYQSVWNAHLKFCQFYELQPFPASPSNIAAFITLVSFSVKSYQTINHYLSALHRLHVFCHFDMKAFDDIHVQLTQKGLEKSMVHVPHRKAPLSPAILLQFRAHLNLCDSAHLALLFAFLLGFFTFFRTANLVPRSLDTFSSHTALSRGSVTFTSSGALLTITCTKTRQSGDTALVIPVPGIQDHLSVPCLRSSHCFAQSVLLLHTLSSHSHPPQTS